MAIEYPSGTIVNTTFTGGTRAQIANGIAAALQSAGWRLISSSGSDYKLESVATPSPQSLAVRVRAFDRGSGNCARLAIMNTAETNAPSQNAFLLPANLRELADYRPSPRRGRLC